MNMHEVLLTPKGKEKIEAELEELLSKKLPKAQEAVNKAREKGGLSENKEYDAAKEKLAKIEARIEQIKDGLANATIVNI